MLTAISPIDGRYRGKVASLATYFSEEAIIRYRVLVEVEYFIALCELPLPQLADFDKSKYETLRDLYRNFTTEDAQKVKDIEKITNHDVKSVEYFIKEAFDREGLQQFKEFVHFGLTSQDINNTAFPLATRDAVQEVYYPLIDKLLERLDTLVEDWKEIAMLARTHGQPASPTRLGKEIQVFAYRVRTQLNLLKSVPCSAKFGGATGNFNAHHVAYPDFDWKAFGNHFVGEILRLEREEYTTQISNYDNQAAIYDNLKRINTILIDLNRDMWTYISMNYFKQRLKEGEVGSSAMPHKVNPIDFENSEGNLGIANAVFNFLSEKLPISRLQRDLTDSTVIRNIGVPLAHTVIGLKSLLNGLGKLQISPEAFAKDLEDNWAVVAEAIQTILRRENYPKPYEALKKLTRVNTKITEDVIKEFIDTLDVSDTIKEELKQITPSNYTGV
ncbi:adenylosuccinate lyase [Balneicella halophila]|uniref:Adenylosuccinate lyase n=1 Tax=Balneicella halophila TaxID=1537566 RepID=A0A7L4US77_BALHA|nr:adenylosuccinate lyase [Balneicella halophila]PVX52635.1 adenylosuccinate lyase [Balneicella halophila]